MKDHDPMREMTKTWEIAGSRSLSCLVRTSRFAWTAPDEMSSEHSIDEDAPIDRRDDADRVGGDGRRDYPL